MSNQLTSLIESDGLQQYVEFLISQAEGMAHAGYDFPTGTEKFKAAVQSARSKEHALLLAIDAHIDDKNQSAGTEFDYSGYSDQEIHDMWRDLQ